MNELPQPAARKPWKWLMRLGLGVLLLIWLLSQRKIGAEVGQTLRAVSPGVLVAAVSFYWAGQLLSAWKWQLLLRARGVEASLVTCCRLYFAGMFGNLWLPTNIGGDGLRALLITQSCPGLRLTDAAASIFVERLTGFAALLLIALAGIALAGSPSGSGSGEGLRLVLSGLAVLVLLGVVLAALSGLSRRSNSRIAGKIAGVTAALSFYLGPERRAVLAVAMVLSLAFQASQVVLNIGLASAAGLHLPVGVYWWLCPLLSLSGLLPVGIGGLGVREAAAVGLLANSGYAAAGGTVVGWSLIWQVTVWLSSLPGAMFVRSSAGKK